MRLRFPYISLLEVSLNIFKFGYYAYSISLPKWPNYAPINYYIKLIMMIMDGYFIKESGRDMGTLYQLKVLTERTNVETQVSKGYHADSSFFDNIVDCHVIAPAMTQLNMADITDTPEGIPDRIEIRTNDHKRRILRQVARNLVERYAFSDMGEVLNHINDHTAPG